MPSGQYFVYLMASPTGTLYVGMTNNLERRVFEHKNGIIKGFTKKYGCTKLIYFEETSDVNSALAREKCMKKWNRQWKIELIEKENPEWVDLFSNDVQKRRAL